MERVTGNHSCRLKYFFPLLLLTLSLSAWGQVDLKQIKDVKAFASATEKGKPGKFKAQKVKGKISGMGALLFKDGSLYYGDFYDKELDGRGTLISVDSISNCPGSQIYVGRFKDGAKNGKGRCYNSEGELVYEGKFKDDAPSDAYPNINPESGSTQYFTEIETDDCRFIGEFSGDEPNGACMYAFNNGDLYVTSFKEGEQNGLGLYIQADGVWALEKVEDGISTPISSSTEYQNLRKEANAMFRASLSQALGYFAAATQKGAELASQIQSMSSHDGAGSVSFDAQDQGPYSSSPSSKSTGNKYNLSEQQSYNRDKSTYNRYDSMLSKAFAGNSSASQSEIREWQSKMRQLREKWEKQNRSFPHSTNEDR